MSSGNQLLSEIENVKIDASGRFKYILIRLRHAGSEKYVVRGFASGEYHGIS